MDPIDFTRHAVVEASAGTGKTYTIEKLVLRLLREAATPLENILLVTYTEKATGELKSRLRSSIEQECAKHSDEPILADALDHFDQAPIFTIHGFCQRMLQEYALEQQQDFRAALVDDAEILRLALRDVQRKEWHATFGPHLRDVLERSNYGRDTAAEWDRKVLELARNYQPRCGHQLRPAPAADWWRRLDEPLTDWAGQLEVHTVLAMRRYLDDYKRQRGLQSFDDMIAAVEKALDPAQNPQAHAFAQALRDRFRFGIVDEFQDTDPLQWLIFARVFLHDGASRLFVVGDPKQAIFAFRNADLPTYLKATRQMAEEHDARSHPLQVNWRSAPELLDALNCLFGDGDWFAADPGIKYLNVMAPEPDLQKTKLVSDLSDRAALTLVDVQPLERLKAAQKQFARYTAHEIHRLLHGRGGQPSLVFQLKGHEPRPLNAGDICVLVFRRLEAEPLTEALRQYGIPYDFHKQTGLWQTDEAIQLETLLRTLTRPDDRAAFRKALLTCFFRVAPADLVKAQDLPARHPARLLYQRWLTDAEGRHWSALFQSLLEETGLLFAEDPDDPDADRRLATFRHLCGALERIGHGENRDLLGLLDWIKQRRLAPGGESETRPDETQRPRVKIMTVHASKGLEFPIVFLAGGFTGGGRKGGLTTYRDEEGRKVFDLCPDTSAGALMAQEALAEQRRLLYVALTRAMFKLYVPQVKVTKRSMQWAGPIGTVLLPALHAACPDKLGPLVAETVAPPVVMAPPRTETSADEPVAAEPAFTCPGPLFPAFDGSLAKRRIVVRSFSSMSRYHMTPVGEGASYGEKLPRVDEEVLGPAERDDPLRGPVFGDMVHQVLEAIDFAEVGRAAQPDALLREGTPARTLLDRIVRADVGKLRTRVPARSLEQACLQQVAQLVWAGLHTPLAEAGGPLWQVPVADRLHEVEFHYPEHEATDGRWEDGFLTGYIDLVFRRGGRYFLLDWKTNLLADYTPECVARCMDEADYHRQYRLYLQALHRWLRRRLGRTFDFPAQFGGVYYLFVRGLNGADEQRGVFFRRPVASDLDLKEVMSR